MTGPHLPSNGPKWWLPMLRVAWAAQAIGAIGPIGDALAGRSGPVRLAGLLLWWAAWFAGLVAALVPSVIGLTVMRLLAPAFPLAGLAVLFTDGVSVAADAITLGICVATTAIVFGAETGRAFVQASAYGDERRYPLRPPGALVAGPLPAMWLASVGATLVGVLLLAARTWIGAVVAVVGLGLVALLTPRFHLLARRWLVFVPAGLVVHDHVPLAETLMVRAADVGRLELAEVSTSATDLTAGALGPAVEIHLRSASPAALRATGRVADQPGADGRPTPVASSTVATDSVLVSPSRPGVVLAEARSRGW